MLIIWDQFQNQNKEDRHLDLILTHVLGLNHVHLLLKLWMYHSLVLTVIDGLFHKYPRKQSGVVILKWKTKTTLLMNFTFVQMLTSHH